MSMCTFFGVRAETVRLSSADNCKLGDGSGVVVFETGESDLVSIHGLSIQSLEALATALDQIAQDWRICQAEKHGDDTVDLGAPQRASCGTMAEQIAIQERING